MIKAEVQLFWVSQNVDWILFNVRFQSQIVGHFAYCQLYGLPSFQKKENDYALVRT